MSSYLPFELGVKRLPHILYFFSLGRVYYAYTTPDECLPKLSVSIERRVSLFELTLGGGERGRASIIIRFKFHLVSSATVFSRGLSRRCVYRVSGTISRFLALIGSALRKLVERLLFPFAFFVRSPAATVLATFFHSTN